MIGKRETGLMKNSAIIIITSRGEIVDENVLYKALKHKQIAGAGLDVFVQENEIRKEKYVSPLFKLENVVVTPHYAGNTYDNYLRRIEIGFNNIVRAAEDNHIKYVVNKEVLTK